MSSILMALSCYLPVISFLLPVSAKAAYESYTLEQLAVGYSVQTPGKIDPELIRAILKKAAQSLTTEELNKPIVAEMLSEVFNNSSHLDDCMKVATPAAMWAILGPKGFTAKMKKFTSQGVKDDLQRTFDSDAQYTPSVDEFLEVMKTFPPELSAHAGLYLEMLNTSKANVAVPFNNALLRRKAVSAWVKALTGKPNYAEVYKAMDRIEQANQQRPVLGAVFNPLEIESELRLEYEDPRPRGARSLVSSALSPLHSPIRFFSKCMRALRQ